MKKRTRSIVIGAVLVCLLLMLAGCGSKADSLQYVEVSFSGYNGNGQANAVLNEEALIESVIGSKPKSLDALDEWLFEYDALWMGLEITCVPEKGLSNGDTVEVTVAVSGDAAAKISGGKKEFVVSGLPDVETVDIFKAISLEYNGIIGDSTSVILHRNSDSEIVQSCQFIIEPARDLQNGDTVIVTIANTDALAEQYLCIPQDLTKTFTVSGLDAYLMDANLLSEEQIREIIDQYVPISGEEDADFWSYSKPVYYKTYFCIGDKGAIDADANRLMVFSCYDAYLNGDYRQTNYVPLIFRNVILSADGTVNLNYENGTTEVFFTDPDSMVAYLEEDYTVVEIRIEY